MKIALLGATGTIGQRILQEALTRGYQVTAIVRDPARVSQSHANLRVTTGDIFNPQSLASAASGHDVVISAFGPQHDQSEALVEATRALVEGVKLAGVSRLVMVGGAGSLEVASGVQLVDTPAFPEAWRPIAIAHRDALAVLRTADLDWTSLSPAAMIMPGERTGSFRTGGEQLLADEKGESRISAEDYAIALIDEVENPRHIHARFTVAY